jgi:hypothetical protein
MLNNFEKKKTKLKSKLKVSMATHANKSKMVKVYSKKREGYMLVDPSQRGDCTL